MKTRTSYIIFVRPPGSSMWTQHMKPGEGIPWVSYKMEEANKEADLVTLDMDYCTRVVSIEHPAEIDEYLYAKHADGDVKFVVASDTGVC